MLFSLYLFLQDVKSGEEHSPHPEARLTKEVAKEDVEEEEEEEAETRKSKKKKKDKKKKKKHSETEDSEDEAVGASKKSKKKRKSKKDLHKLVAIFERLKKDVSPEKVRAWIVFLLNKTFIVKIFLKPYFRILSVVTSFPGLEIFFYFLWKNTFESVTGIRIRKIYQK